MYINTRFQSIGRSDFETKFVCMTKMLKNETLKS